MVLRAGAPDPAKLRSPIVGSIDVSHRVKKVRQTDIRTHTRAISGPALDRSGSSGAVPEAHAAVHCGDFAARRECLASTNPVCEWQHRKAHGKGAVFEAMPKGVCARPSHTGGCVVM
eukprot:TRINITY_DN44843_c0_g1_i1.p2 TRINITY_DN44843_c0_g1~~TRINITY_DN44843_c0_g1_i1.p2  ORF type:complete len:117 (+),score=12.69 TRINITY_DN44843_c0_g1_i1:77-427(+)